MPRYIIDIVSGDKCVRDEDGADYESFRSARQEQLLRSATCLGAR